MDNVTTVAGIELRVLYNPFAPEEVEVHDLVYQPGVRLSDYLDGLPTEANWMVFHNGAEVELADAPSIIIGHDDRIGLILVPQGNTVKSVLRIVMMAAAAAVILSNPGLSFLAIAAISIGTGLISAFLLAPKPPKSKTQDSGQSYGLDGAKNSATEGIPYPVVYGTFRVAGNFSDTYTENVGDDQYLYLRTVLNDGLVKSITNIEVNEQPLANYKDAQVRIELGDIDAGLNDWFARSTVQKNKGGLKLDTAWTSHITSSPVDIVRFDVTLPAGLVSISEKKGTYRSKTVRFETRYRQLDPITKAPISDWGVLPSMANSTDTVFDGNGGGFGAAVVAQAVISAKANVADISNSATPQPAVEYRAVGEPTWQTAGMFSYSDGLEGGYVFSDADPTALESSNARPTISETFDFPTDVGDYEVRGVNGATVTRVAQYPQGGTGSFAVTNSRTRPIRKSFESIRLDKGYYEVSIRRTNVASATQYEVDEAVLTDVAEINVEPVSLRGTANLSLRIRLNEQLNQIPNVTALVEGSVLQEYDIGGAPTIERQSGNLAWIAADILSGEQRGGGVLPARIDWPRYVEFAKYCDDNNLEFNGVFDTGTNIGDALQQVLRIGHAASIPFGTKYSLAIDRPRDPVTVFTQAGMVKGSFQMTYLSMQERANDFEVTYYDKLDRNKAKTIRYVDPKAVTFNELPRKASTSLVGIDNLAQATTEMWRMIYSNRLIIRTATFESFMESINCSVGEVALLQHDQMDWAFNGRTVAGSAPTQVRVDQPLTMSVGSPYRLLVHFSALQRGTSIVSSVIGSKIMLPTSAISDENAPRVTRLRLFGSTTVDFEVTSITKGASLDTVQLTGPPTGIVGGSMVELWDTDVMEERDATAITPIDEKTSLVFVASAFSATPDAGSNFVFGKVENVRKPYVLTGISGSGIEKRRLSFVEYHEGVYSGGEVDIPIPVSRVSDRAINHVRTVMFDYENLAAADRRVINARLHWNTANSVNYAGSDIYMALNGEPYRMTGTAMNSSEFLIQLSPGDEVQFKVVAFNKRGDRAPFLNAPSIEGVLNVIFADLDPPTNVVATPVSFEVDGKASIAFDIPVDTTGVETYEVQYRAVGEPDWVSLGNMASSPAEVAGLPVGEYQAQVRSLSKTSTSLWAASNSFTIAVTPGSVMANLLAVTSDDVLSTAEKLSVSLEYQRAVSQATALIAKAVSLGAFATERTAAQDALDDLDDHLDALTPAWDDISLNTPIDPVAFKAVWVALYSALAALNSAITGRTGTSIRKVWQRSVTTPATPANSALTPAGWFDDPAAATGTGILWASSGERPAGETDYVWRMPTRDEAIVGVPQVGQSVYLSNVVSSILRVTLGPGQTRGITGQANLGAPTAGGNAYIQIESRVTGGSWSASNGLSQAFTISEPVFLEHEITVANVTDMDVEYEIRGTIIFSGPAANGGPITNNTLTM